MRQLIAPLLKEYGLSRVASQIEQSIKDSVVIKTQRVDEDQMSIGQSKIGGLPDLPDNIQWPAWKDKPLAFIAQINLTELPKAEFLKILPSSGMLYFFYSAEQETWGFDPKDKGSWRVVYRNSGELKRRVLYIDSLENGNYNCCSVRFHLSVTIPAWSSIQFKSLNLNQEEDDRYSSLRELFLISSNSGSCFHRFLGYSDPIQNDMQLECQLVTNGLYCGDASGYNNPKVKSLEKGATNWELLLQIDSDPNASMMWGDVGRIYYWTPGDALRRHDFDTTWMISQCA